MILEMVPEQISVDDTNTVDHDVDCDHDTLNNLDQARESSHHTCPLILQNKLHKNCVKTVSAIWV